MLLILHNLPKEVTSLDVRHLIQEQCGFRDVILDNLLDEGPGKRITVGLAEEEDAAILMRKLNGLHYKKCQLYVEDVRKKKLSTPSYPILIPSGLQPQVPRPWFIANVPTTAPASQVNNSNMPYYMTQNTNNMNFGKQTQTQTTQQNTSIFSRYYNYKPNEMLQTFKANNFMNHPLASHPNTNQAPNASPSFKTYQIDRDKQGDTRDNTTHFNWRENKSPPSKRHENFGNFNQRESRFENKTSEWNKNTEVSRRSRGNYRSPPRGRNSFRDNQKEDRRDDFDSSRRSRSSRSNPRDKDTYMSERQSGRDQNSLFGRQKDHAFDQHERRNIQKRDYAQVDRIDREDDDRPKRSFGRVFGTSTMFSSKPENSFFVKPNRSIFDKIMGSRGFEETSDNKITFTSPKKDTFKSQVNFPVLKRARFDPPLNFGNKKYVNPNAPSNKATDLQKMMTRHTNWRTQSATLLAKEVLKNASTSKIENPIFKIVLKKLRECIMSRIDVIMGDKIATNLDEILSGYRTKFNNRDDIIFFKAVMEKVERENEENADDITGPNTSNEKQHQDSGKFNKGPSVLNPYYSPSPNVPELKQQQQYIGKFNKGATVVNPFYSPRSQLTMKPNFGANGKQKGFISQNRPKRPFNKDPKTMPKLPRYPNSDKQEYKQFQKNALLEREEGFYTMEPEVERAVNEEVEKLFECYVEACEPSTNKEENSLRNKIITSSADEFKKIIKLNVTKRVLKVTDGLTLRIFATPKPPPKASLDDFLKKHGAISLKKSETKKMFIATFDSYENYDRLVAAQTASFGNVTIHMKPFHVLGPTTKKNSKAKETVANANNVEDFTKDVDDSEIDLTNDMNDDADVMLVENEDSEVVVIRDDLDKSFNSEDINDNVDVKNDNVQDFNDLKALSNVKVDDSNIKESASNENKCISNDKVGDSNEKVNISNEIVNHSGTQVNATIVTIEDSRDKVQNSQCELNKSETSVLDSLDDIFNDVDEILEDDLEDF